MIAKGSDTLLLSSPPTPQNPAPVVQTGSETHEKTSPPTSVCGTILRRRLLLPLPRRLHDHYEDYDYYDF